jgi:hypothetical protein
MPATTFTSSVMNRTPKDYHVGVTFEKGKFVFPVAGSLSDIINNCKVPHGAVIADFYEYHSSGQTAAVIDFGFDRGIASGGAGNASCVVSGGAIATMNRMSLAASPTGANVQISLSDSDPVRYAVLQGKAVSGTFTTTVSMGWGLFYVMDER